MDKILKKLMDEREGYILWNENTGVEIKATEKFLCFWKNRGFTVIDKCSIRLIEKE